MVDEVNPNGGTVNCGNIIDAVAARLSGRDPDATSTNDGDGSFTEIEGRFNTTLGWGSDFQSAYDAVAAGGPGTMAVVGIGYSGGTGSHVVILANDGGTVGIVEAQNWGDGNPPEVITDVDRANERYNSDGGSNIGWGMARLLSFSTWSPCCVPHREHNQDCRLRREVPEHCRLPKQSVRVQ